MSSNQKVLLLSCTHSFGAKFLQGQIFYMKQKGFKVVVISAPGTEIEQLCLKEGATFLPFPFRREISLIDDVKAVFRLRKIINSIKPSIINTGTPKAGLLVCLAGRLSCRKPIVFTLRGLRSETLSGIKRFIVRSMEKFTCSLAHVVIPISPSLDLHAQKIGLYSKGKSVVLGKGSSNGVDISKFSPSLSIEAKNDLRKSLGISSSDYVISYIGRITNDKGVVELFNSFKQLAKRYSELKLLIVGKFEDEDAIPLDIKKQLYSHPQVILEGYREDIKSIYEIIDVLVLFSKREGFGNILIEASSMEVPVIASHIPGCIDAVDNGNTGFLVNNPKELLEKLEYYIFNRNKSIQHGVQGRKWVSENFKSELIWDEQLKLYNSLLD